MNLSLYTAYFHDGSIIDIQHDKNEILLFMESAEIPPEDLTENLILSAQNALKGILHLKMIKSIWINELPFYNKLHMLADLADILDFEMENQKIHLFLRWENYPPKKKSEEYLDMVIECDKIDWENIPNL